MARGDYPPEPLSVVEVRALLGACDPATLTGLRNRALVVVLWRAGLRCAEALALRPVDVDYAAGTIRVLHGKGNRARTVGIDGQAADVVRVWDAVRSAAGIGAGPLFCSLRPCRGASLSGRYVRAEIGRLGRKAGIRRRVHPHGLRHTLAVELVCEGWPVTLIQRQLGHASVATTDIYLNHIHPAEVIDRARARTWG
jgi:site-specific recombinase XerD